MNKSVDLFRLDDHGVRWLACVNSVESAKARIQELAANSPGEYLIRDQTTGSKYVVKLDGAITKCTTDPGSTRELASE
jgi:hypothetical protein